MNIVYFEPQKHYDVLKSWWTTHKHAIVAETSLPYGVVVYVNEVPVSMSFIYTCDKSDMCQIAWTTTNPEHSNLRERHKSVETAIDALLIFAEKKNKKYITCFSASKGLNKIISRRGFIKNASHELYIGGFN